MQSNTSGPDLGRLAFRLAILAALLIGAAAARGQEKPAEGKPAENAPAEAKGAEAKPVEGKPAEKAADENKPIKIVLVGDSTVAEKSGWGPAFAKKLKAGAAECVNLARGGRSSKSYRAEGWWKKALAEKPDYVLIQFGHNDQPGKGPERETDPQTTYRENLAKYIDDARDAGAVPVVVTSLVRRHFDNEGKIKSNLVEYAEAAKAVAAEKKAPLVDLHAASIADLNRIGPQSAAAYDAPSKEPGTVDRTHLSEEGGEATALLVIQDLLEVVPMLNPAFGRPTPHFGRAPEPTSVQPWCGESRWRRLPTAPKPKL